MKKSLRRALLTAAFLATTGWFPFAAAQGTRAASTGSRVGAERAAADLKQGMTPDQVQQLLGKPWRTALTGGASESSRGALRWTYTWTRSSSSDSSLNIDFTATAAEQWLVKGWNWSGY